MLSHKDEKDFDNFDGNKSNTILILGGAALVVIIVVLCLLIWRISHDNSPVSGNDQTLNGGMEDTTGSLTGDEDEEGTSSEPESSTESEEPTKETIDGDVEESQESSDSNISDSTNSSDSAGVQGGDSEENGDEEAFGMTFTTVEEIVTAKDVTNLRSAPSSASADTVVAKLSNGETAKRTGINEESGWSRLEYNGQTVYAVSSLLTTDLTPPSTGNKAPSNTVVTSSGRTITFQNCDDTVTPKIECNLRVEPSTDGGEETIRCLLRGGETVHRTGYDEASGWSRVEYNGEVLYVVSSLVYVVED